ncbi:MAG TPA: ester cyclase [Oryzihumus sp.]|nr:ester cyclase [Oryzihumus sp.]
MDGVPTSESNKALVRRHFEETFNQRHLASCDVLFAHDFIEHAVAPFGVAAPGLVDGPAHMRQTVEWLIAQYPDLHMRIEQVVAEGDLVVARIRSTGTNLGPLNGVIPATGRRFDSYACHWFRVVGGLLAEHWAVRDDLTSMVQIGVITPPRPRDGETSGSTGAGAPVARRAWRPQAPPTVA